MARGEQLLGKAIRAYDKYETAVKQLDTFLKDKIEFEFAIDRQPGDGHMIIDLDSEMKIAPVDRCLSVIYMRGKLTREDHNRLCI